MTRLESILFRTAHRILRIGLLFVLTILLYTCFYIYNCAPDGGVMNGFLQTVAMLLQHVLATLGLLFAAATIPHVKLA